MITPSHANSFRHARRHPFKGETWRIGLSLHSGRRDHKRGEYLRQAQKYENRFLFVIIETVLYFSNPHGLMIGVVELLQSRRRADLIVLKLIPHQLLDVDHQISDIPRAQDTRSMLIFGPLNIDKCIDQRIAQVIPQGC